MVVPPIPLWLSSSHSHLYSGEQSVSPFISLTTFFSIFTWWCPCPTRVMYYMRCSRPRATGFSHPFVPALKWGSISLLVLSTFLRPTPLYSLILAHMEAATWCYFWLFWCVMHLRWLLAFFDCLHMVWTSFWYCNAHGMTVLWILFILSAPQPLYCAAGM